MATKAAIGIIDPKTGGIEGTTCHYDGYLDHVGKTLVLHYDTTEKVKELLSYGQMSSLGSVVGNKLMDEPSDQSENRCEFYCRDYGESFAAVQARKYVGDAQFVSSNHFVDYFYLFDGANWYYTTPCDGRNWELVKDCLEIEELE